MHSQARRTECHERGRIRRGRKQNGFVVVWVALSLLVLMGMAGLSVDLGNWYLNIQRLQRAVDAAALDGAPFVPSSIAGATSAAYSSLINNGIPATMAQAAQQSGDCTNATPCMQEVPGSNSEFRVQAKVTVQNTFLQFLGIAHSFTFSRTATATYLPALSMSNLDNVLGGPEPSAGSPPGEPATWEDPVYSATHQSFSLMIQAAGVDKENGDRFSTQTCSGGDGCVGGVNTEYDPNGYYYHVHVDPDPSGQAQYLRIEAYDPAYVGTWATCPAAGGPGTNCTGDEPQTSNLAAGDDDPTTYTVLPNQSSITPMACGAGSMNGVVFPGYGNPSGTAPAVAPWNAWFHRWVPICAALPINPSMATDVVINVRSGAGDGLNDFKLRAGVMSSTNPSTLLTNWTQHHTVIGPYNRLPVFNNYAPGVVSTFHLTRVTPEWAGRTINWQLYDFGDIDGEGSGSGTITITGSPDVATTTMLTGSTCQWTPPGQLTSWQPTGTAAGGGCEIDMPDNTIWNGRTVNISWAVPSTYTCDETSATGCWININMVINGATNANDHTTWTLLSNGEPLHLIQ